jgi:regulator of protease activity HflC (stomatin/prohibitin superfamily)
MKNRINGTSNQLSKTQGWATWFLEIVLLGAVAGVGVSGCTNPKTPEGHEGYVYYVPLIFGKVDYQRTLRGPASTGMSWRLYVTNVDMRARSYKEDFRLLTSDNLNVAFEVNTRISLRPGSAKEIVENWGGKKWYGWNVKEPLRTIVRREVTRVSAIDIQLKTNAVRQRIYERLLDKYKKSPIKIESVDIGNIQFPPQVTRAIEKKIGQKQELERQQYLLAKTKKEAAIRVLEALKAAKQQRIISSTLDPLYVQRQAVQVYKQLGQSSNKTIIVLPNSDQGTGLPLVLRSEVRKTLSPADKKLLENMEKRYMKMAKKAQVEAVPGNAGGSPLSTKKDAAQKEKDGRLDGVKPRDATDKGQETAPRAGKDKPRAAANPQPGARRSRPASRKSGGGSGQKTNR